MMARRGPDDSGFWTDEACCTLAFRRLAILDLSPNGHQPMHDGTGRYVIVFNGELYNFREMRAGLEKRGVTFRSSGDTEVVLQALMYWGMDALARFNGMFALGFYDKLERRLLLARDHAGIKPLYTMQTAQGLVFASQYNQLLAHPWRQHLEVSGEALTLYLHLGYIPAPYGLLQNTSMLEPGTWLSVDASGRTQKGRYFEFPTYREPDLHGETAYEAVNAAVSEAVRRQMISDVPLGSFLSGGIDSPLVTAKMRAMSSEPVRAFTIGTNGDALDESLDAARYAQDFGVEHIVEHFAPEQAFTMLNDVIEACGEPFGDYSIFPTMLVSRLARSRVTVMLAGDGGDELFWGYSSRFGSVLKLAQAFGQPRWIRTARWGAKKFLDVGNGHWNMRQSSIGEWYKARHTHLPEGWSRRIFPELAAWPSGFSLFQFTGSNRDETAQWLRWNEFVGHLTRVLLKVDRASMFHSLEVRVPLLDREVIDIATRIDWRSCLDLEQNLGKLPLRHALAGHTRRQTQAKRGFSVPMDTWLRDTLRPVVEDTVLKRQEILGIPFDQNEMAALFGQHLSGQSKATWGLWILLSLFLWEERHYMPLSQSQKL
jgi:asparagine synthase (glutamine-hydrolysing)